MTNDPRFSSSQGWDPTGVVPKVVQVNINADPTSWLNELRRTVEHEVQVVMMSGTV